MDLPTSSHPVVVAAVDLSEASEFVVARAARQSEAMGAQLHIVHVFDGHHDDAGRSAIVQSRLHQLGEVARQWHPQSVSAHTYMHANPWQGVIELSLLLDAEMIVLGTHGRVGLTRLALGSVAEKVLRHAHCAVLVDRPHEHAMATEPVIEPPCPECVRVRTESEGRETWCPRHTGKQVHARLHYAYPEAFTAGSNLIRT